MIYADEAFYYATYCGTISTDEFYHLAPRASAYIDYMTQGRAAQHADRDAVKMCCCALIDQLSLIEAARNLAVKRLVDAGQSDAEVKSESVGSYSRTLATGAEGAVSSLSAAEAEKKLLADTCREYLGHTGLLYRGGGRRCTLPTL